MNIDCKNCSTCKYHERKRGRYNEYDSCCNLGNFYIDKPKEYICNKYEENEDAVKLFIKENFKQINNFRKVNQNNSSIPFGNNNLFVK